MYKRQTQDGDDLFNVDFSGGNFPNTIVYNGGSQTATPGDLLALTSGTFATVTHTFVNDSDGSVDVTGNNTITYTGLEPIIDNLNVANRVFNFTGGAEIIILDAGGTLDNQIDSTLGESVDFNNPLNSLTINAGTGDDEIYVEGLHAGFDADLFINGEGDYDFMRFQTNPTDIGNGALTVSLEQLVIIDDITTTGNITTTTTDGTLLSNATVQTINGNINITGGTAPTPGYIFTGLNIRNSTLQATGTGSISLTGTGGNDGSQSNTRGVLINGTSNISTNSGNIVLNLSLIHI